MMVRLKKVFKNAGLLMLALFFSYAMYRDFYVLDPYNPSLGGTSAYGHNGQDSLRSMLEFLGVELLVAYAIIRPWSYKRSWKRALLAFAITVPWMMLMGIASMHSGRVVVLHVLWLVALSVVFFIIFWVSVLRRKTANMP